MNFFLPAIVAFRILEEAKNVGKGSGLMAYGCIFGVIAGLGFAIWYAIQQKYNKATAVTVDATVVSTDRKSNFLATFELANGNRVALHLPVKDFQTIVVGDKGRLTYKKDTFAAFSRTSSNAQ